MRILVLSLYYSPDLSAGSFRATALVSALRERGPPALHIDLISTLPNRYSSFSSEAPEVEEHPGLSIRRIALPVHRSDMIGQTRSYVHFARGVMKETAGKHYDLVFATSGRLMTAALASLVARRQSAPLYLDIRDIFVDTIKDVLPGWASSPTRMVFAGLERFTMRRADRINLVSRGFESYFRKRYPRAKLSWFTNGVDDEFQGLAVTTPPGSSPPKPLTILYAGNIGEGQGLHSILPQFGKALGARARIVVIGDGGRREALERALVQADVHNVEIRKPEPRAQLVRSYQAADVLFLHLGAHPAFEKVLPSKLFEYAALGKPVLAGVAGHAARFVRDEITNAAVFEPCDAAGAIRALDSLHIADAPRTAFVEKFARAKLARDMADEILALAASGR